MPEARRTESYPLSVAAESRGEQIGTSKSAKNQSMGHLRGTESTDTICDRYTEKGKLFQK